MLNTNLFLRKHLIHQKENGLFQPSDKNFDLIVIQERALPQVLSFWLHSHNYVVVLLFMHVHRINVESGARYIQLKMLLLTNIEGMEINTNYLACIALDFYF